MEKPHFVTLLVNSSWGLAFRVASDIRESSQFLKGGELVHDYVRSIVVRN